ncbi:Citrate lyase subunit beta-like protein [Methylobacterium bullatum]|uniref:Citrate lyase subunit beta-like protein n=1 Tax=Methylobacterium bullatum TaxID=570505 RepID=A0A679JBU6_9HYPH|nr:Citrate lyase subunit beta-like protein [Methylobacterium bullatum]
MRAFLIVPADSGAIATAMASGAHALIVDVTGLSSPVSFPEREQGGPSIYLRSCDLERDLTAMIAMAPHGIVLSRCEGVRDVMRLGARLAVEEAIQGLAEGSTQILAFIETARGALVSHTLADAGGRLVGIAWDAEAIRAEIGASATRDREGGLSSPLAQVRALVRLTAAAARVTAIDTPCLPGGDLAGEVEAARDDGFEAKLVLEPDQAGFVREFSFRSRASSAGS